MPAAGSAEEAEARAALLGLQSLANRYRGPVELETDCKNLADALTADVISRTPHFGILMDLKAALAVFSEYRVRHIPRECNRVAHELAAKARQNGDLLIIGTIPYRLRPLVLLDCNPA